MLRYLDVTGREEAIDPDDLQLPNLRFFQKVNLSWRRILLLLLFFFFLILPLATSLSQPDALGSDRLPVASRRQPGPNESLRQR